MPEAVPTVQVAPAAAEAGVPLVDLLVQAGVRSRSEARRLIEGGGVQVNGVRVADPKHSLGLADLTGEGQAALVRYGKGKVVKVELLP